MLVVRPGRANHGQIGIPCITRRSLGTIVSFVLSTKRQQEVTIGKEVKLTTHTPLLKSMDDEVNQSTIIAK
jgi:hypothetical protein